MRAPSHFCGFGDNVTNEVFFEKPGITLSCRDFFADVQRQTL